MMYQIVTWAEYRWQENHTVITVLFSKLGVI